MPASSRPTPIPATIGTLFGGLWALVAALALPEGWMLPAGLLAGLCTVLLIMHLWRTPSVMSGADGSMFRRGWYRLAVGLEVLAIVVASWLSPRLGLNDYLLQIVGIIVGLHFIGLWAATGSRRFLIVSAMMCVVSATAMLAPAAVQAVHLRQVLTGVGNALVLWFGVRQSARFSGDNTARSS